MLTEKGRVVAVEGNSVWIETLRQSSCGSCSARAGCGHGMLNSRLPGASRGLVKARLPAESALQLRIHDDVEISLPEGGFLRAAALLYGLPVVATLTAAVLAERFLVGTLASQSSTDLRVTLAAAAGLAVGLALVRLLSGRVSRDGLLEPRITGKL